MRRSLFLSILILSAGWAEAQPDSTAVLHKKRSVTLEIHGGYSMALARYAGTDRDNTRSGYASNGFFIQAAGSWLGKSGLGLGISYTYQNNALQSGHADDTLVGQYAPLGTSHWNSHYLLAGPVFQRAFGRFLLSLKVQVGGVLTFSPLFRIWMPSTDSLHPNTMTLSEGPGFGVAVEALAGIGYRLTDNLSLNLSFVYLGGNPNRTKSYSQYIYEEDPETGDIYSVFVKGDIERKRKISTFNIGIGLIYHL